jgi:hypothetical protein
MEQPNQIYTTGSKNMDSGEPRAKTIRKDARNYETNTNVAYHFAVLDKDIKSKSKCYHTRVDAIFTKEPLIGKSFTPPKENLTMLKNSELIRRKHRYGIIASMVEGVVIIALSVVACLLIMGFGRWWLGLWPV